jgi:sec-independent protein translocase protein TatA
MPSLGPVGPLELIIILAIALLLLGPRRLPELGSAVGKTIREFRKAASEVQEEASLEPASSRTAAGTQTSRPSDAAPSDRSERSG